MFSLLAPISPPDLYSGIFHCRFRFIFYPTPSSPISFRFFHSHDRWRPLLLLFFNIAISPSSIPFYTFICRSSSLVLFTHCWWYLCYVYPSNFTPTFLKNGGMVVGMGFRVFIVLTLFFFWTLWWSSRVLLRWPLLLIMASLLELFHYFCLLVKTLRCLTFSSFFSLPLSRGSFQIFFLNGFITSAFFFQVHAPVPYPKEIIRRCSCFVRLLVVSLRF